MNTAVIILGFMTFCVMLAVAVRVIKARRLRELLRGSSGEIQPQLC